MKNRPLAASFVLSISRSLEQFMAKISGFSFVRVAMAGVCLAAGGEASAASYTWDGGGTDSNFGTAANWTTDVAPVGGTGNAFVFTGSTGLSPVLNGTLEWFTAGIEFGTGASSFNIGPSSAGNVVGQRFNMSSGSTVTQDSANDQSITATVLFNSGTYTINGAGAGSLTLNSVRISGSQTLNINHGVDLGAVAVIGAASTTSFNVATGVVAKVNGVFANSTSLGVATSVTKSGAGTLELNAANTYTGTTTISAGSLLVNNATGSGTGASGIAMTAGVLGGTGIIAPNGKDISIQGGTLTVGHLSDSAGTGVIDLAFQKAGGVSNFSLSSSVTVRLDIWGAGSNEKLVFGSGVNAFDSISLSGATLQVDSAFTGWQVGDSFDLFDWGTSPLTLFSSAFVLPDLTGGLSWDTSELYTSGTITVVPEPATIGLTGLGLFSLFMMRRKVSA